MSGRRLMGLRSAEVEEKHNKEAACDRTLVTGGAVSPGSHLVEGLLDRGFKVTVLDDLSTGRTENLSSCLEKTRFVQGGIRDRASVKDSLKNVSYIFHLAALASIPYSVERPEVPYEVKVNDTTSLDRSLEEGLSALLEWKEHA